MFCPNCGATVREGAQFCAACGGRIGSASAATAAPAQPAPTPNPSAAPAPAPTASIPMPGGAPAAPAPTPVQPAASAAPAGQPAPVPGAPAQPGPAQPVAASPLAKELFSAPNMQTIGIAAAIGFGAALVLSLFPAIAMNSYNSSSFSVTSDSSIGQALNGMFVSGNGINFFHFLFLALAMGLGGGLHYGIIDTSYTSLDASNMTSFPLGLTGVALLVGTAFGAYMFARAKSTRFKYTGLISGLITALLPAVVITLLAAIAAAPIADGSTIVAKYSGATIRTFFMAYLLSALGALAGYALAQYAPDSKTVFGAAWQWAHRVRGFVRTVTAVLAFQLALFFLAGLVALFVTAFSGGEGVMILTFPVTLMMLGSFYFTWATFGAMTISQSGQLPQDASLFSVNLNTTVWPIWLLFVAFVLVTFVVALRTSARNLYDRAYMGWIHSWKSPVAVMVFWLIASLLFEPLSERYTMSHTMSIGPALWYFLVMGIWAFLVEVVALTFGPTMVVSMPGFWPVLVGGTVRATPQQVVDYIHASDGMFGKWPTWGAPSAGVSAQPYAGGTSAPSAGAAPAAPGAPAAPATPGAPAAPMAAPTAPGAAPMAAPDAGATAMTAQQKKYFIIGGAIAGFLVVFGIVYGVLSSSLFSAKSVANNYVAAIASGDYDKASSIANPHVDAAQSVLLTSKASTGENTRITNARISQTTNNSDGTVTAQLTYTLNGKEVSTDSIKMVANGSKFLIFKNWTVAEPLVKTISVYASDAPDGITVNGVKVTAKNATNNDAEDSGTYQLKVYPGIYKVGVPKSDFYSAKTVSVNTNDGNSGTLDVQPTDKLTSAIQDAVDAKLDECAESTEAEPSGCPFSYSTYNSQKYRNFSWSIDTYPEVNYISLSDGSYDTDYDGKVTVKYEYHYYDGWESEDDWNYFSADGNFTIKDGKVTVDLSSSSY
ncbi:zinc ribbon domain-containing protein [Bifidobacterium scaligerum]|uniref:zinc ribbon domain-containing protein n=1 Tax=Bifidobacterium scaligerum TaxID=2052656 RepID=UPI0013FE3EB2|nr:zinc ribbon domain-containing protein [Bifidobacterium scaligerum]